MNQIISVIPNAGINGSALAVPKTCPSKKKVFMSAGEAVEWEASNREKYNLARQYVYKCDDCPDYHLSATSPEAFAMAKSRALLPRPVEDNGKKAGKGERVNQVKSLLAQGIADPKAIAARLDISVANASVVLSKVGKQERERLNAAPITIDAIDAEEKVLIAQLQKLTAEKQRLLEMKALKIMSCWDGDGVLIQKENERMALRLEDAQELAEKLLDFFTAKGGKQ